MPISSEAIDRFLQIQPPYVPQFKHTDPDWLRSLIYDVTGKPYKPRKTQPRPHQLEGIAFALYQRKALLFYGMRLGKTLISLHWAEQLRIAGHWRGKGLIICHAPIALWVWESEAEKHSNLKVKSVRNKIDELIDALESDCDLIVIPWSGLQNIFSEMRQSRKGKNKLYPDLEGAKILSEAISLVIIDEIHAAKNWQSLRFQIAKELVKNCRHRLGLTGTPFGRKPYDVWAQCYLIDDGQTLGYNYQFFEAAFGNPKHNFFSGQMEYVFDKKKQPILEEKLSAIALPYKLEECQAVPVLTNTVELEVVDDQLAAYKECINKIIELPNQEVIEIRAIFLRMRQISSGYLPYVDEFGNTNTIHFRANAKIEWLTAFLEDADDLPMIIIHEFTETGKLICDALTKAKIKHNWLHGATKDKALVCKEFQDGTVSAIVVQAATGSMAIDLSRADYMLFFESPVSPITHSQISARPLSAARGNRTLLVDTINCTGVERKILTFIQEGGNLMEQIIHERSSLGGKSNGPTKVSTGTKGRSRKTG